MLFLISFQTIAGIIIFTILAYLLSRVNPLIPKTLIAFVVLMLAVFIFWGDHFQPDISFWTWRLGVAVIVYAIFFNLGLTAVREERLNATTFSPYVLTFILFLFLSEFGACSIGKPTEEYDEGSFVSTAERARFSINLFCFLLSASWLAIYLERKKLQTAGKLTS